MSLDVVVFDGDTVDDAAVCGVDVGNVVVTGGADFFDPAAGFFGDFFFALAFVQILFDYRSTLKPCY